MKKRIRGHSDRNLRAKKLVKLKVPLLIIHIAWKITNKLNNALKTKSIKKCLEALVQTQELTNGKSKLPRNKKLKNIPNSWGLWTKSSACWMRNQRQTLITISTEYMKISRNQLLINRTSTNLILWIPYLTKKTWKITKTVKIIRTNLQITILAKHQVYMMVMNPAFLE